jgi:hypothetical protein
MPRYTRVYSVIRVVGHLWQPGFTAAQDVSVDARALDQIKNGRPLTEVTRDDVADWLTTHTGDFSAILDFQAEFSEGAVDHVLSWASEDSEFTYTDCMCPVED